MVKSWAEFVKSCKESGLNKAGIEELYQEYKAQNDDFKEKHFSDVANLLSLCLQKQFNGELPVTLDSQDAVKILEGIQKYAKGFDDSLRMNMLYVDSFLNADPKKKLPDGKNEQEFVFDKIRRLGGIGELAAYEFGALSDKEKADKYMKKFVKEGLLSPAGRYVCWQFDESPKMAAIRADAAMGIVEAAKENSFDMEVQLAFNYLSHYVSEYPHMLFDKKGPLSIERLWNMADNFKNLPKLTTAGRVNFSLFWTRVLNQARIRRESPEAYALANSVASNMPQWATAEIPAEYIRRVAPEYVDAIYGLRNTIKDDSLMKARSKEKGAEDLLAAKEEAIEGDVKVKGLRALLANGGRLLSKETTRAVRKEMDMSRLEAAKMFRSEHKPR